MRDLLFIIGGAVAAKQLTNYMWIKQWPGGEFEFAAKVPWLVGIVGFLATRHSNPIFRNVGMGAVAGSVMDLTSDFFAKVI